jgi:hypothetical protein
MDLASLAHMCDIEAARCMQAVLELGEGRAYTAQTREKYEAFNAKTIETARKYEELLAQGGPTSDDYLNLAVLYWQCQEPGFLLSANLDFIKYAGVRYAEVLEEAEKRFPTCPEIGFWKSYTNFYVLGAPFPVEECQKIMEKPGSNLVPYLYLFSCSQGREYQAQATKLLADCKAQPTLKNHYIISVIESGLKMKEW